MPGDSAVLFLWRLVWWGCSSTGSLLLPSQAHCPLQVESTHSASSSQLLPFNALEARTLSRGHLIALSMTWVTHGTRKHSHLILHISLWTWQQPNRLAVLIINSGVHFSAAQRCFLLVTMQSRLGKPPASSSVMVHLSYGTILCGQHIGLILAASCDLGLAH